MKAVNFLGASCSKMSLAARPKLLGKHPSVRIGVLAIR